MTRAFSDSVPELGRFWQGSDTSNYAQLPDDWSIGISDVVNSSGEIGAGRYKAVNLAGAGTIRAEPSPMLSAVTFLCLFLVGMERTLRSRLTMLLQQEMRSLA